MKTEMLLEQRCAMIAVRRRQLDADLFQTALRQQQQLLIQKGDRVPLWQILRQMGAISQGQAQSMFPGMIAAAPKTLAGGPAERPEEPVKGDPEASSETGNSEMPPLVLTVTSDRLTALLKVNRSRTPSSVADVRALLADRGVDTGILPDDDISAYLADSNDQRPPLKIAQGRFAVPPEPDRVEYFFDINPFRIGTLTEKGTMDWKDRGEIPQVSEGELLARIFPGQPGKAGRDVFGKPIEPSKQRRARLRTARGARVGHDGLQFFATTKGQPKLSVDGKLGVFPSLQIDTDVGLETGHVEFDGHVVVRGAIQKGYHIVCAGLEAREILSQQVDVQGDVICSGGIIGAKITAAGRIQANHINRSHISAAGDVVVRKEILDSTVVTGGRCIIDGGKLLSSEVWAKQGIKSDDIGSPGSRPNILHVGIDRRMREKISAYEAEIAQKEAALQANRRLAETLHEQADQVNTELGQVAQVQDKRMVAQRTLLERIEARKRPPNAKEEKLLESLVAQLAELEQTVAGLMEKDEQYSKKVKEYETQIEIDASAVAELKTQIENLLETASRDKGVASVAVTGTLHARTEINGPRTALLVSENYTRACVKEKKIKDPDNRKPWQMVIEAS
jgi:uncharacterized protein (DUF342 family)